MFMRWPDRNIEKSAPEVHDAEDLGPMQPAGEVPEEGAGVCVRYGPLVDQTEVGARPDPAPGLVCQVECGTPISICSWLDLFNDPVSQHLIPDLLPFFSLCRIGNDWPSLGLGWRMIASFYAMIDIMSWLPLLECGLQEFRVSLNHFPILLIMHGQRLLSCHFY